MNYFLIEEKKKNKNKKKKSITYKDNIIFLDFDGVLTSKDTGTYEPDDPDTYTYSDDHLYRLLRICNETNAKIIIVSNWRRYGDEGEWKAFGKNSKVYKNPLPKLKEQIGDIYLGDIPKGFISGGRKLRKGQCLKWFFDDNNVEGNYVILDDEDTEGFNNDRFDGHFLKINSETGLTDDDVSIAIDILNGNLIQTTED